MVHNLIDANTGLDANYRPQLRIYTNPETQETKFLGVSRATTINPAFKNQKNWKSFIKRQSTDPRHFMIHANIRPSTIKFNHDEYTVLPDSVYRARVGKAPSSFHEWYFAGDIDWARQELVRQLEKIGDFIVFNELKLSSKVLCVNPAISCVATHAFCVQYDLNKKSLQFYDATKTGCIAHQILPKYELPTVKQVETFLNKIHVPDVPPTFTATIRSQCIIWANENSNTIYYGEKS